MLSQIPGENPVLILYKINTSLLPQCNVLHAPSGILQRVQDRHCLVCNICHKEEPVALGANWHQYKVILSEIHLGEMEWSVHLSGISSTLWIPDNSN